MINAHQRKQFILLGFSVVMLVATVLIFLQVFRPDSIFVGSLEMQESTTQDTAAFPLEFFRDPRFVLLQGDPLIPPAEHVEGVRVNPAFPPAPESVVGVDPAVGSKAFVEWQAPLGFADARFIVYRSEIPGVLGEAVAETTETSFLDVALANGSTYYYTVHTSGANGESANTEQVSVTPTDTAPPSPPSNVTVTSNEEGEGVVIAWAMPLDDDVVSLTIYRSDTEGALGEALASGLTETSYADTSVPDNTPYYYTVTAVDASGNESEAILPPMVGRDNPFVPI